MSIPPQIGRLGSLRLLHASDNRLASLPREIGQLTACVDLSLDDNGLTELPAELACLSALGRLSLRNNPLAFLPQELGALSPRAAMMLSGTLLPCDVRDFWANLRCMLPEIFAATTALGMIRSCATTLATACKISSCQHL